MSATQLIQAIEEQEYILPKSILKDRDEEQLAKELVEIFNTYPEKLEADTEFRKKYTELVNYLLVRNLYRDKTKQKNIVFDSNIINYLLSKPKTV